MSMQQADGAQGLQVIMDIAQDVLIAFPGIPQQFADGQSWETGAPVVETREGQEVVIDIGWGAGASERPEEEEAVIDQIEGFGLVAEMVLAMRSGSLIGVPGCIWVACTWDVCGTGVTGLVGAGVVDKIIYTVYNVTEMSVTL